MRGYDHDGGRRLEKRGAILSSEKNRVEVHRKRIPWKKNFSLRAENGWFKSRSIKKDDRKDRELKTVRRKKG